MSTSRHHCGTARHMARKGGRESCLFKRETEHLCLRPAPASASSTFVDGGAHAYRRRLCGACVSIVEMCNKHGDGRRAWQNFTRLSQVSRRCVGTSVGARVSVLAHLGSVAAVKSPSIVSRRVASLSRRRRAEASCRALGRAGGGHYPSAERQPRGCHGFTPKGVLCRRSARACGVAASTADRHIVGGDPSRQGKLVHGEQQMW